MLMNTNDEFCETNVTFLVSPVTYENVIINIWVSNKNGTLWKRNLLTDFALTTHQETVNIEMQMFLNPIYYIFKPNIDHYSQTIRLYMIYTGWV